MITGNWGQDIALLLKAAADAGLQTDWYTYYAGGPTGIKQTGLSHRVFAMAVNQAKSIDPKATAAQLDGMKAEGFDGDEIFMRKDDHQLFQDMYIGSFGPLDPGAKFDEEGAGWGWKSAGVVKAQDTILPTTCKMERP